MRKNAGVGMAANEIVSIIRLHINWNSCVYFQNRARIKHEKTIICPFAVSVLDLVAAKMDFAHSHEHF